MGHTNGTQNTSRSMAQNHLLRRGSRFFFRRRVPLELKEILGKAEIKRALGTSDRKEAARLAAIETVKCDAEFERARKSVQHVAPAEAKKRIGFRDAIVLVTEWYEGLEQQSDDWLEANLGIFQDPEALNEALATLTLDEHVYSGGGFLGRGRNYKGFTGKSSLNRLLEDHGMEFTGSDQEFDQLAATIRKGYLANVRNDIQRLTRTNVSHTLQINRLWKEENPHAHAVSTPAFSATVGEVLDEFLEEQKEKGRSGSTIRVYTVPVRFLREVLGEKTVLASVDRDRMKKLREMILRLPANATKFYRGKSLQQCIELAQKDGRPIIAPKTAESYFGTIQAIFNFATRIRKIPFNPGTDVFNIGTLSQSTAPRALFQIEQLNALFASPHYPSWETEPGRFWVPIIALYHGLRMNEACQLYTEDVFEKDGIWCFRISESRQDGSPCEKVLKTKSSRRTVPLHPELLALGFLGFVRQRGSDGKCPRLFPDLNTGKMGYYSDPFQKWFGRLLRKALSFKPKATFHAFRHMWKDALTEASVPETLAKRLGGWTGDTSAAAGYGHGPSPKKLLGALEKVSYPGLNIARLRLR